MLIPKVTTCYCPHPGIRVQRLCIPEQQVWIRSAEIDLGQLRARVHIDCDLLQRSFNPAGLDYQPAQVKTGQSLLDWLANQTTSEGQPFLACNALHTNFVRGNGFVILDGRVVCKPEGTIPLDGERYQRLEGAYTALILSPGEDRVEELVIQEGRLPDRIVCDLAISGPRIVHRGWNTARDTPVRLPEEGQTMGNEINFLPDDKATGRTSFIALGIGKAGRLMAVSAVAGTPYRLPGRRKQIIFKQAAGNGLTLVEMADLMIQRGATEAILAGGSGDTQQFIQGDAAWCALPRPRASRAQVDGGLRGLGAILAIYGE